MIGAAMWAVAAACLSGAWMVNRKMWQGQATWCATNIALVAYNLWIGSYPQAGLFAAYLFLSTWGCIKWLREKRREGAK